jgi:hypothetical protein
LGRDGLLRGRGLHESDARLLKFLWQSEFVAWRIGQLEQWQRERIGVAWRIGQLE